MSVAKTGRSGMRAEKRDFGRSSRPLKSASRVSSKTALGTGLIIACVVTVFAQYDSLVSFVNQPISKVRLENQWQQVTEAEVGAVLSEFMGTGFFSFNVRAAKQKLEKMPWVEFVSVKRIWPDTLALELQEEVAIAKWGQDSYLNQIGEVISPTKPAINQSLPSLYGPDGSQVKVMSQYQKLNQLLFPEGIRLTELQLSQRGSWGLMLNDRIQVSAGKEGAFGNITRLVSFLTSQPSIDLAEIGSVDLRYSNGFAVKAATQVEQELSGVAAR